MEEIKEIKVDLTVVGAGLAGICTAIAAARHGLSVALINDRPVLGGNASSELGVQINGAARGGHSPTVYARETGIIEEIKLKIVQYGGGELTKATKDAAFLDLIYGEPNIKLFLNTNAYDVEMVENRIAAVKAIQINAENHYSFISSLYADCTGDGTVGAKAGASYMWGREGKNCFNESLSPESSDNYVMGDTIIVRSIDTGKKTDYRRPNFAYDPLDMPFLKNIGKVGMHRDWVRRGKCVNGSWWWEFGGQMDPIHDNEEIVLELRKIIYGLWDYVKNSGEFQDVETLALDYLSSIPGKRESRRFIGEYVLTQNDIDNKTKFHDPVCTGGWTMDIHAPKGIYDYGPATHWNEVQGVYNIPFRCLYSKVISVI